jgi:DamX protein
MSNKSVLVAFMFLAGACGGSDSEPKTPSTTQAAAPDEKSEESIQMSAAKPAPAPAPAAKPAATEPAKPAATEPAKPAEAPKPAGQPK